MPISPSIHLHNIRTPLRHSQSCGSFLFAWLIRASDDRPPSISFSPTDLRILAFLHSPHPPFHPNSTPCSRIFLFASLGKNSVRFSFDPAPLCFQLHSRIFTLFFLLFNLPPLFPLFKFQERPSNCLHDRSSSWCCQSFCLFWRQGPCSRFPLGVLSVRMFCGAEIGKDSDCYGAL